MIAMEKRKIAMFVDKACPQHWIVRDADGSFWSVPPVENAWEKREPFDLAEGTKLEAIPGHYKYLLGLPG